MITWITSVGLDRLEHQSNLKVDQLRMVRDTGIEPVTPTMSM